jgi:predicted secreted hydrolase
MAFQLRREDGTRDPYDQGLLVDRSGRAQKLTAADFTLLPGRRWTDASGVSWPVRWTLDIDGGSRTETLRIEALVDDQKMDTLVSYWEGIVGVTDASGRPLGRGYLEMTGYGAAGR